MEKDRQTGVNSWVGGEVAVGWNRRETVARDTMVPATPSREMSSYRSEAIANVVGVWRKGREETGW